jgi:DNA polymerase IV (DinB-like DNA polymerase)
LPVEELHGVGPVTAEKLHESGVETAGDLAAADRTALRDRFGERGAELHDRARGIDDREVTPRGDPKSLSRESAFDESTTDDAEIRQRVEALAAEVAGRARRKGALYRTVGIKIVTPPYDVNTRERSLPGPVDDPDLVESVARDLLEEFSDVAVRKVGVRVSNLEFTTSNQATLEGWETATDHETGNRRTGSPTGEAAPDGAADGAERRSITDADRATTSLAPGQTTLDEFTGGGDPPGDGSSATCQRK